MIAIVAIASGLGTTGVAQDGPASSRLVIHADQGEIAISRNLYGQFAEHLGRCIYGGIWVGEDSPIPNTRGIRNDVVAALKNINVPVLRWPGGCFADEYHWQDGIGPRADRPTQFNSHWGGVVENNHFGTHEFMDLCEQIGAEPYIAINVGSGTVREMMEWIEYLTSDQDTPMANLRRQNGREKPWKVRYFGIGNESWGCGGSMRPEYYADIYRRYQEFAKNHGGNRIFKVACGANDWDFRWTEVVMENVGNRMNGLSLHYYTIPTGSWGDKGSATEFGEDLWHGTLRRALQMDTLITRHSEIMDKKDPRKRIGLLVDEWGVWHNVEPGTNPGFLYQQNTLRDALVAAVSLNIFNQHCDRVRMANIAQTINVLQAMALTDGSKMILTPTYHVFEMFTPHHDATLLPSDLDCGTYAFGNEQIPQINASASRDSQGVIHVTVCNLHPNEPVNLSCDLLGTKVRQVSGRVLTASAMQAHNTFAEPAAVVPREFTDSRLTDAGFAAKLPSKSVVVLELR
ncbi:MAG: alpha-N-arabinofuranosidase [Verrucomicrobiales bacterium]|nr:alpha-N-arabinofuranosidase [Verrucomicrobiales bacterium]